MIVIAGILVFLLTLWLIYRPDPLQIRCEAWKSLALALEVELECYEDWQQDVPGEGCGTRAKRLDRITRELGHATDARWAAINTLITLGERDDS
jgi:hypothetical protein